jgi:hypothetical protein
MKRYSPLEHPSVGEEWLTDTALKAYLLGRATDADAARVEERLLEDEQLFATLQSVEDDLFDDYARKKMSAEDAQRFLAKYGDQRDRLAFAGALAARTSRKAVDNQSNVRWGWMPLAMAASLVLAVGSYLMLRTAPVLPAESAARQAETAALPTVLALLSLGGSRAEGAASVISLPKDTGAIQLRVRLNPADRFDRYAMELRSSSNLVVGRADDRRPTTEAGDLVIEGTVPAVTVIDGSYELAVSGLSGTSAPEPIGFVQVRVSRTP